MDDHAHWPARTAVCLDCRTALPAGYGCLHGKHRITSLTDPAGREVLLHRVWGSASIRKRLRDATRAGSVGGGVSLLDACRGGEFRLSHAGIVIVIVLIVVAISTLWLLCRWIFDVVGRWRLRRHIVPRGAERDPAAARPTGYVGTIAASGPVLEAPIDGRPCIAFGLRLLRDRTGLWRRRPLTMLRDGAGAGFEVVLDSGERARIPAGACALDLTTAGASIPSPALDRYLETIDPQHGKVDDLSPFPCDRIELVTLAPGDRVEILSPVTVTADIAAPPGGYREAATILVPVGPVRLRRL